MRVRHESSIWEKSTRSSQCLGRSKPWCSTLALQALPTDARWRAPRERLWLQDMPRLSQELHGRNLEADDRIQAQRVMEMIRAAIVRPDLSTLIEDYHLFVIEEFDRPLQAEELLAQHRSTLAQVLRFETLSLSGEQQEEALAQRIAYFQNHLVLIDTNTAIIYNFLLALLDVELAKPVVPCLL